MTTPAPGTAAPSGEAPPVTPAADATPAPAAPPAPASPAPAAPAADAPAVAEPQGKVPEFDGPLDEDRAKKLIANVRADAARSDERRLAAEQTVKDMAAQQKASQEAFEAALIKKIANAFGGPGSEEEKPPTVEELAKQLADQKTETEKTAALARQRDVELAVWQRAAAAGGDAGELQDSRSFLRAIRDLDPAASTFADEIEAAIKKAVEGNPRLAAKQPETAPAPPARGGADLTGTPGGKRQLTGDEVKRMKPDDIDKARKAGQLRDYLSGPG